MNCPYCEQPMQTGELQSQKVPIWVSGDKQRKLTLPVKKHLTYNETTAYYCVTCKKMMIDMEK